MFHRHARPLQKFTNPIREGLLYLSHGMATARYTSLPSLELIRIVKATFYRSHPDLVSRATTPNEPMFSDLTLSLPATKAVGDEHWAVIGPSKSGKTSFLNILRGKYICTPPLGRRYPALYEPTTACPLLHSIQYIGTNSESGITQGRGAFLGARYESRREITDFSLQDYILDQMELNPLQPRIEYATEKMRNFEDVLCDLDLDDLAPLAISALSTGQFRRAQIAKCLMHDPLLLLLDEPFIGLDPFNVQNISNVLHKVASESKSQVIVSLRPQDIIPRWITHVIELATPCNVKYIGPKRVQDHCEKSQPVQSADLQPVSNQALDTINDVDPTTDSHVLVDMSGIKVSYGERKILGHWTQDHYLAERDLNTEVNLPPGLHWRIRRGDRWAMMGPNGSGKTSLVSMISSDHPLAYAQPIRIFGRTRLPQFGQAGIPIFDLQKRIGQSSPEIHAFFPPNLSLRDVVRSAWSETFFSSPLLTPEDIDTVDTALRWFHPELRLDSGDSPDDSTTWADDITFASLPATAQRIVLFLRAVIKKCDIVILDEAFSQMDAFSREKCMLFLAHGQERKLSNSKTLESVPTPLHILKGRYPLSGLEARQALIVISHVKDEVPDVVNKWLRLPHFGFGQVPKSGTLSTPLRCDDNKWNEIWS